MRVPRCVRASCRVFSRHWKAGLALCLLLLVTVAVVDRPYSLLYTHLHTLRALRRRAEDLNRHRTEAAVAYFERAKSETPAEGFPQRRKGSPSINGDERVERRSESVRRGSVAPGWGRYPVAGSNATRAALWPDPVHKDSGGREAGPANGSGTRKKVGVAIAVITVKRATPSSPSPSSSSFPSSSSSSALPFRSLGYLTQTVAALHAVLRHNQHNDLFRDSVLFVCNVEERLAQHAEAAFLKRQHVHTVERYGTSSLPAVNVSVLRFPGAGGGRLYRDVLHGNVYNKERVDYMFCLQAALQLSPGYVLMVEDDAMALPDMPSVVQHALHRLFAGAGGQRDSTSPPHSYNHEALLNRNPTAQTQSSYSAFLTTDPRARNEMMLKSQLGASSNSSADLKPTFAYLKLFYPLYFQGFAYELPRLLDLASYVAVLTAVVSSCLGLASSRSCRHKQRHCIAFAAVLSLLLCLLLGRQNLAEVRRVSHHLYRLQPSPDCCTPAILYPRDVIPSLLTSLSTCRSRRHVDLCIADYVKGSGLPAYSVEPNLFSHIGTVTSLRADNKKPEESLFHEHVHLP